MWTQGVAVGVPEWSACRWSPGASLSRILSAVAIASLLVAGEASGQATPRTITGTVRDTLGRPLSDVVVALDPNRAVRATRTDASGRFRFPDISPGQYDLRFAWVGYGPDERSVVVPREGLDIEVVLRPLPYRLDTLRVVATRSGIIGTAVQRSDFRALGGVDVELLGRNTKVRTKADGAFVFDVGQGSYVVLGQRSGFASRMIPVPVLTREAVEVALALDSASTKELQIGNNRIQDVQMRWRRGDRNGSAIVGRHEWQRAERQTLETALRYSPSFMLKGFIWTNAECIHINGIPQPSLRAKDILAEDVAMVEVYNYRGGLEDRDRGLFRNYGTECGVGPVAVQPAGGGLRTYLRPNASAVAAVYVWLKESR